MTGWSRGQQLALEQLKRICDAGDAAVVTSAPKKEGGWCSVEITMDLGHPAPRDNGKAETAILDIPRDFPFSMPQARVSHRRFAGLPHVLWGKYICLYLSESDWDPSDGMFGFLERLADWFVRAADGTLEEAGQPLHPPLTYPSYKAGTVVIPVDFPDVQPGAKWTGMAVFSLAADDRAEIVAWLPLSSVQAHERSGFSETRQSLEATAWRRKQITLLGPVIVLPEPLSFEFPKTVGELVTALESQKVSSDELFGLLRLALRVNKGVITDDHDAPLYVIIGAPMRGVAGESSRHTHLAVWRLATKDVLIVLMSLLLDRYAGTDGIGMLASSKRRLEWTVVYEQRPQITTRRDSGRPAEWLHGRSVLILGCGALGARIAEHCARAGAARLKLADKSAVSPGILVRQPYAKDDVGLAKASVLTRRLSATNTDMQITPVVGDILRELLAAGKPPPDFDLIVDATANRSVSARIESLRWQTDDRWPPILTVGVGHDCERAIASMALPGATGGGADVLHNFALAAMRRKDLADFAEDFFPDPRQRKAFQPEPGCSDATFQGSDAEASALAAQMFAWGLRILQAHSVGQYAAPKSLLAVRMPTLASAGPGYEFLEWQNDLTLDDREYAYQIRFCPAAIESIRSEALTTAHLENEPIETGGMLLGRIDDACRVIWVTAAEGPTADSERAQHYFRHGLAGVGDIIAAHNGSSGGRERFVGMWHTHPGMSPSPSTQDLTAMRTLLVPVPNATFQGVLAIFGGRGRAWSDWLHDQGKPTAYAGLYRTTEQKPRLPLPMPGLSAAARTSSDHH
jgi:integrative and conjugative element protein (TIGR02256 family)